MTGLGLSEMKTVVDAELAVAHLVFKVADLKRSCQFYSNLGLPPFAVDEKLAIVELTWRHSSSIVRSWAGWRRCSGKFDGTIP
jgi:hypothetical protein